MSKRIPKQGIETYMAEEVARLWPPNRWNRLENNLFTMRCYIIAATVWVVFSTCMLAIPPFSTWTQLMTGKPWWDMNTLSCALALPGLAVMVTILALVVIAEANGRPLKGWRRYWLLDFLDMYDYVMPQLDTAVAVIRADAKGAEFKVAVLDMPGDDFQFVLFQMSTSLIGTARPFGRDGKAIAIFDGHGRLKEFGEAYRPFDSFALRNIQA